MARRRVIAYPMHEREIAEVNQTLEPIEQNEAFQVGYMDDSTIDQLRGQGIVVEVVGEPRPTPSAATARRSIGLLADGPPPFEATTPEPGELANWRVTVDLPLVEGLRHAMEAAGGEIVEALGRYEYLVVGTTETVDALAGTYGVVDVSRYAGKETQPLTLRAPSPDAPHGADAATAGGGGETTWDVVTASPQWSESTTAWLSRQDVSARSLSDRMLRVELPRDSEVLARLAHQPGVLQVVEHVEPQLQNDRARALVGLPTDAGAQLGRFDGTGQLVAVADTGIDAEHSDFAGRIVGVEPLGRPARGSSPGQADDPDGHGTHVAGTIAGSGAASGGAYRGVAAGAQLFVQSLYVRPGQEVGGLPDDVGALLASAYDVGARVHNDSWGAEVSGAYNTWAAQIDEFVDAHPDMLVVVAAGNAGNASSPRIAPPGYPDHYSIGAPATAKNALTVGASRSDRPTDSSFRALWPDRFPHPPTAEALLSGDPECLAAISSRGPCDDERMKPDVVAPGTCIMSAKSSRAADTSFQVVDGSGAYGVMSGTSMAAPVVSGLAAVVRQWFTEERGHVPSAALLKAALINGARPLTGKDAQLDGLGMPNPDQGFGCVDLRSTLPGDLHSIAFKDTWGAADARYAFSQTGRRHRFEIEVVESGHPLRATLTWVDRPGRVCQQNLGLFCERPDGSKLIGNANRAHRAYETDMVNTVEHVVIESAESGWYMFNVISSSLVFTDRPTHWALVVGGAIGGDLVLRGNY